MLTRPRKTRRGLGLLDSMLAIVVLTALGGMMGNVVSTWVEQKISQAEARALSAWADAGEAWLLEDRGRITAATSAPESIPTSDPLFARLVTSSPHRRRAITLWYRDAQGLGPGQDQVYLLAVASDGDDPLPAPRSLPASRSQPASRAVTAPRSHPGPVPGDGINGVGAIPVAAGSAVVIGPGLEFSLAPWIAQKPGLASPGDMVALRAVSLETTADTYLHRDLVPGRLELNRMKTNLDMGGNDITGVAALTADGIKTPMIRGPLTVTGGITVGGGLVIGGGELTASDATFSGDLETGTLTANSAEIKGEIFAKEATIETLIVEGRCLGCRAP